MENTWVSTSINLPLPPFAVIGGYDMYGAPLYVGRSYFQNEFLPAKIAVITGLAYVAWGHAEYSTKHYEVLVGKNYIWKPCLSGKVPANAVYTGNTMSGEPLYVGRSYRENSLIVGKMYPAHGCLYMTLNEKEIRTTYSIEVLVKEDNELSASSTPYSIPPSIASLGCLMNPAPMKVGEGMQRENVWLSSSLYMPMPAFAIKAGTDIDGLPIYVGRAYSPEGECIPAKIARNLAYVSSCGVEYKRTQYEVLISTNYSWVECCNGAVPPNAVCTGIKSTGEATYVGRGHLANSLAVGMVIPTERCMFISFDFKQYRVNDYEVLVLE